MPTFVPILLLEGMRTVWMLISVMPTRTVSKRKQKNVDKIFHQYYLYLFEPSQWNRCKGCRCIKMCKYNILQCISLSQSPKLKPIRVWLTDFRQLCLWIPEDTSQMSVRAIRFKDSCFLPPRHTPSRHYDYCTEYELPTCKLFKFINFEINHLLINLVFMNIWQFEIDIRE